MKRRMFFGALAAAFCPIPVMARPMPLSDFEKMREFFRDVNGKFEGYRYRDWRPVPPYSTQVVRTKGRIIWASPKRSI